jgi:hypothetical protein
LVAIDPPIVLLLLLVGYALSGYLLRLKRLFSRRQATPSKA